MGIAGGGSLPRITEKHIEVLEQALRMGCYVETAAAYAGIRKNAFYEWLKKGFNHKENGIKSIFSKFHDRIEKAMAQSEIRDLSSIDEAANGTLINGIRTKKDWRAAAWKLERRAPKRWSQKSIHKIESDGSEGSFTDDQIQEYINKILNQKEQEVQRFLEANPEEEE